MAETRKLAAFLRRMWSDSASLPGPTRSGHLRNEYRHPWPCPSFSGDPSINCPSINCPSLSFDLCILCLL